jgi:hypothetical protein
MKWVRLMNNVRRAAEKKVLKEVYTFNGREWETKIT